MASIRESVAHVSAVIIAVGLGVGVAAEGFQKLSATQIRAKLIGKQFTDEVHWGELYEPNGRLVSQSMGRKRVGTWQIEQDLLCTDLGKDDGRNCYEVWMSKNRMQLRNPDSNSVRLEGIVDAPPPRRR